MSASVETLLLYEHQSPFLSYFSNIAEEASSLLSKHLVVSCFAVMYTPVLRLVRFLRRCARYVV